MAKDSPAPSFDFELVVIEPFAGYDRGQIITDTERIAELIQGDAQSHFVRKAKAPPTAS